jgi:hypothetical protein
MTGLEQADIVRNPAIIKNKTFDFKSTDFDFIQKYNTSISEKIQWFEGSFLFWDRVNYTVVSRNGQ